MMLNYNWQLLKEVGFTIVGSNALRLYGKLNVQNTANNGSNVSFQLRVVAYTGSFYSTQNSSNLWCAGTHRGTQYYDIGNVTPSRGEVIVGTWSFDLWHDDQGRFSSAVAGNADVYGNKIVGTGDVAFSLPTIARKSNPTVNNKNLIIGDDLIVYTNRKSGSFTHTIEFSFGSYKKTINNVTTSTTIKTSEIKEQLYTQIPNAKKGTATVKLTTFNGSTNLGNNSTTLTLNVNENECKPVLTEFNVEDTNLLTLSLTGNNQNFIKGFSNLKYTVQPAQAKYSSTIVKYKFADGKEEASLTHTTNAITSRVVSVVAIDSRGISSDVVTKNINLLEYSLPKMLSINPLRENGIDVYVNMDVKAALWNGNFGKGNNQVSYFGYSINGSAYYDKTTEFNNLIVGQAVDNIDTKIRIYSDGNSANFDKGNSYTVEVKIIDGLSNVRFNETVLVAIIEDGKIAISYFKDSDGEYHLGLNGMPREDSILAISGLRFIFKGDE